MQISHVVMFINRTDTSGASLDALFLDWEQNLLSLQDLFRKLVVHTEVRSSQLPDLHQLFLFKIFDFGHDRLGLHPPGRLPPKW